MLRSRHARCNAEEVVAPVLMQPAAIVWHAELLVARLPPDVQQKGKVWCRALIAVGVEVSQKRQHQGSATEADAVGLYS